LSVSTRPAAFTAATSVVWSFELTALSMMSLLGSMGAPPTITWAAAGSAAADRATERPMAARRGLNGKRMENSFVV